MKIQSLSTIEALLERAESWNELWEQSDSCLPTLRAETLANYLQAFEKDSNWTAIVVTDENGWLAAIPLVVKKNALGVRVGYATNNEWNTCCELLVRRGADMKLVTAAVLQGIRESGIELLWLDGIRYQNKPWHGFFAALEEMKLAHQTEFQYHIGLVDTDGAWERYQPQVSKQLRKQMRRAVRTLDQQGKVEFWTLADNRTRVSPERLRELVTQGFQIEDSGWKGDNGTSVNKSPGLLEFYLKQAELLSESGHFDLQFIYVDDRPIAFEYGYVGGKVYYSHKVGYDPQFAKQSPGQLLMSLQIEQYFDRSDRRQIDAVGVLSDATAKWITQTAECGRAVIATRGWKGNLAFAAYRHARNLKRRLRGVGGEVELPKIGIDMSRALSEPRRGDFQLQPPEKTAAN